MIWIVSLALLLSVGLNFFLGWYIWKLVVELMETSDDLVDFYDRLAEYSDHIEVVYGLETFYGDEVLKNLLIHSKNIVKEMKVFRGIVNAASEDYDFLEELEQYDYDEEDDEEEKETRTGKVVFYPGS